MRLLVACLVALSLLVCLPVAASAGGYGAQATFGATYAQPVAVVQAPAAYVMAAPVALAPVQGYGMVQSFGAAGPLYGGSCSAAAFGGQPVRQFVAVPVATRPGLLGRLRAARQGFRRGF